MLDELDDPALQPGLGQQRRTYSLWFYTGESPGINRLYNSRSDNSGPTIGTGTVVELLSNLYTRTIWVDQPTVASTVGNCLNQSEIDIILQVGGTVAPGAGCEGTTHATIPTVASTVGNCLNQFEIDIILQMNGTVAPGAGCWGTTHAPLTPAERQAALDAADRIDNDPMAITAGYLNQIIVLFDLGVYISSDPALAQAELDQKRSGILSLISDILGPDDRTRVGMWLYNEDYLGEGYTDLNAVLNYMVTQMYQNINSNFPVTVDDPSDRFTQPIAVFTAHMLVHYLNVPGVEEIWNY